MRVRGITPLLTVSDVPRSIRWFESLGWKRGFAWNAGGLLQEGSLANEHGDATFGAVCAAGDTQIFLCRGGQGSRGTIMPKFPGDDETDGVWMSWWVDSVESLESLHQNALALGYLVTMPPTDEPWGVREFHLRHPDGHMFRISAGLAPKEST